MLYTWTSPYPAPKVTGVTEGTLKVPTLVSSDWRPAKTDRGSRFISVQTESGGYAELDVNSTVIATPYGNSSVSVNERLPLTELRSAYVRLRSFGTTTSTDANCQCSGGLAPVTISLNVGLPSGVTVTVEQLQELLGIAVSALSEAVTTGTVVPLSAASEVSRGAINL